MKQKDALHEVAVIRRRIKRDFGASCLTRVQTLSAAEIKALRMREQTFQPVFPRYLNVSKNLVSDCERRVRKPRGPALRLLTLSRQKKHLVLA